jgi:hypothetical protein
MRRIRSQRPNSKRERRWLQVLPLEPRDPRHRSSEPLPRQSRPNEDMRKVIVSEFLPLDESCKPWQAGASAKSIPHSDIAPLRSCCSGDS